MTCWAASQAPRRRLLTVYFYYLYSNWRYVGCFQSVLLSFFPIMKHGSSCITNYVEQTWVKMWWKNLQNCVFSKTQNPNRDGKITKIIFKKTKNILTHVLFSGSCWLFEMFWVFLTCKTNASMNMFDKIKKTGNVKPELLLHPWCERRTCQNNK